MDLNRVAVIVPLYRDFLSSSEKFNLQNNCNVLGSHHIIFIGPKNKDIKKSLEGININDFSIIQFSDYYFDGIRGYNRLMLSTDFYRHFNNWEYILICQLDAYVFIDELISWCNLGFDYIGPPWFTDDNRFIGDNSTLLPWKGCNGGFSLRKVQSFIDILNGNRYASFKKILKNAKSLKEILLVPLEYLRPSNSIKSFVINYQYYEDRFWSFDAPIINEDFKIPKPEVLLKFGFEMHPRLSYKLNNGRLPFGCHAWQKYSPDFWLSFIPYKKDIS